MNSPARKCREGGMKRASPLQRTALRGLLQSLSAILESSSARPYSSHPVSNQCVIYRRRVLILPIVGVALFGLGSYQSIRLNRMLSWHKYYYWLSIPLDRDPLNRWSNTSATCNSQGSDCKVEFDYIRIDPGPVTKVFMTSAFPAFFAGTALSHTIGRYGASELPTFMIATPVLIFAWYYLLSWCAFLLLRLVRKKQRQKHELATDH